MDQIPCKYCSSLNLPTAFFCSNCGKAIKNKPLEISIGKQIMLYLIAFFLCPLGLIPGIKYLLKPDSKSKQVGAILVFLSVVSLLINILLYVQFLKTLQTTLNSQLGQSGLTL